MRDIFLHAMAPDGGHLCHPDTFLALDTTCIPIYLQNSSYWPVFSSKNENSVDSDQFMGADLNQDSFKMKYIRV